MIGTGTAGHSELVSGELDATVRHAVGSDRFHPNALHIRGRPVGDISRRSLSKWIDQVEPRPTFTRDIEQGVERGSFTGPVIQLGCLRMSSSNSEKHTPSYPEEQTTNND